jgi:hypothetical protein
MTESTSRAWRRHRLLDCGIGFLVFLLLPASPGGAQVLQRRAFSSGATDATGGGVHLQGTLGEAGFVGQCSNANFIVGEGFWARAFYSIATDVQLPTVGSVPLSNELSQSYPNPFRTEATISFGVGRQSPVKLSLYDVTGRHIATLIDEEMPAGRYDQRWSGLDDSGHHVASGMYFYRLNIGSWTQTRRMLKLR